MERERGLEWFGAPQIASLSHHLWWYCSRGDAHVTCMVSAAASDSRDSVGVYMAPISVAALEGISALAMQYPALTSNVEQPVLVYSGTCSAHFSSAIRLCNRPMRSLRNAPYWRSGWSFLCACQYDVRY